MNKNQFHFIPNNTPIIPDVVVSSEDCPNKEVLDEIFKIDPKTGLPRNSQQVFLSDDTNPLIKDFIATVLKGEELPKGDTTFKDLPDDVISELTISHGETRIAYVDRIQKYLDSQRDSIKSISKVESSKSKNE